MLSVLLHSVTRFQKRTFGPRPVRGIIALVLGALLALSLTSVFGQQNLPDMGEPADSALSPVEEQQLGAQFMRQIRAQLPLIKDVQLNEYIQNLGNRLVLASGKSESQNFTFFLIDDPQINACLLYTSPSPRDKRQSRMPSSA